MNFTIDNTTKKILYPFTLKESIIEALEELKCTDIVIEPADNLEEGMNFEVTLKYKNVTYTNFGCFLYAEDELDYGPGAKIKEFTLYSEEDAELEFNIVLDYPKHIRSILEKFPYENERDVKFAKEKY